MAGAAAVDVAEAEGASVGFPPAQAPAVIEKIARKSK
jgi:hypothetical protein